MTPDQLFQQLKQALRGSVQRYEGEFSAREKPIPERRAQDILQLEMLWTNQGSPFMLIEETTRRCKQFKTGLLRQSQLRDLLMAVINDVTYGPARFYQLYHEENQLLKTQLQAQSAVTAENVSQVTSVPDLQALLQRTLQENAQLKADKAALKGEIDGIKLSNQALAAQVQSLHVRLSRFELQFERSETPSPTAALVQGVQAEAGKGGRFFS